MFLKLLYKSLKICNVFFTDYRRCDVNDKKSPSNNFFKQNSNCNKLDIGLENLSSTINPISGNSGTCLKTFHATVVFIRLTGFS